jgi:hypothetical protein
VESVDDQLYLALSETALSRKEGPRTFMIRGSIQDVRILLLLDLGSSLPLLVSR